MPVITPLPRNKPGSLHEFLVIASRSQFPPNNRKLLARLIEKLSERRLIGEGWVLREEIVQMWPWTARSAGDQEDLRRQSTMVTHALRNLREQIDRRLAWLLPHFTIMLEQDPPKRSRRYRLHIVRRSEPWDFRCDEAHSQSHAKFSYCFNDQTIRTIDLRLVHSVTSDRSLVIEAVREPKDARWMTPSHRSDYMKLRNKYFSEENVRRKAKQLPEYFPGNLWGIQNVHQSTDSKQTSLQIITTRTQYLDLLFLQSHLDVAFDAMEKHGTFRDWLHLEAEPRASFCPPLDALCVTVIVFTRKPCLTFFISKQFTPTRDGCWDATASGAATGAYQHVDPKAPDLLGQVTGVVYREIGLRVQPDDVTWLGFARGKGKIGTTVVLAMVKTDRSVKQVMSFFKDRRDKSDIDEVLPLPIKNTTAWLDKTPPSERSEFLELGLALAAISLKVAHPVNPNA